MLIMWINLLWLCVNICKKRLKHLKSRSFLMSESIIVEKNLKKRISTALVDINVDNIVDNVDNYSPSKDSPTVTISPAPIVINRSPLIQFSSKKFSISSKQEK